MIGMTPTSSYLLRGKINGVTQLGPQKKHFLPESIPQLMPEIIAFGITLSAWNEVNDISGF